MRGFIGSLPVAAFVTYGLLAIRAKSSTGSSNEQSAAPVWAAALVLYVCMYIVGNGGMAHWLASRRRLRFWPFLACTTAAAVACTLMVVPAWIVFVDRTFGDYAQCVGTQCRLVIVLYLGCGFTLVCAWVPGLLTSALWFAFGRPKPVPVAADSADR